MPHELDDQELRHARVAVPDHVARRDFADEAVALNLRTGRYHGLNRTASVMLEALARDGTVAAAARTAAGELDAPSDEVERDLLALCRQLRERGLIELDAS